MMYLLRPESVASTAKQPSMLFCLDLTGNQLLHLLGHAILLNRSLPSKPGLSSPPKASSLKPWPETQSYHDTAAKGSYKSETSYEIMGSGELRAVPVEPKSVDREIQANPSVNCPCRLEVRATRATCNQLLVGSLPPRKVSRHNGRVGLTSSCARVEVIRHLHKVASQAASQKRHGPCCGSASAKQAFASPLRCGEEPNSSRVLRYRETASLPHAIVAVAPWDGEPVANTSSFPWAPAPSSLYRCCRPELGSRLSRTPGPQKPNPFEALQGCTADWTTSTCSSSRNQKLPSPPTELRSAWVRPCHHTQW